MEEINHKILFNAALSNPAAVSDDTLAELIERYPYAQSLRLMRARRGEEKPDTLDVSTPLLYVGTPHRLYTLLGTGGHEARRTAMDEPGDDTDIFLVENIAPEDTAQQEPPGEWPTEAVDDATDIVVAPAREANPIFNIDDPEAEAADWMLEREEGENLPLGDGEDAQADTSPNPLDSENASTPVDGVSASLSIETVVPATHHDEQMPVERRETVVEAAGEGSLPAEGGAIDDMDRQVMDTSVADDQPEETGGGAAGEEQQVVPAPPARAHEEVSVYDDEHMPYTFLWWLNKARMEHADTYQPYVSTGSKANKEENQEQVSQVDQALLDQQIRENIFHLQPPEEKLTAGSEVQTVSFKVPKETDPIIERFIREEPQIKPPNPDKLTLKNMAKHSAEDAQEIVTETLAKIYVDQGHYNKAIDAYKKLSLKYPEKSSYFAGRISDLEKKFI